MPPFMQLTAEKRKHDQDDHHSRKRLAVGAKDATPQRATVAGEGYWMVQWWVLDNTGQTPAHTVSGETLNQKSIKRGTETVYLL